MKSISIFFVVFICFVFSNALGNSAIDTDNSDFNRRDLIVKQSLAEQGKSKKDIDITRRVRQSIMNDKALSVYAQNIQITTLNGEVTLSGRVKSIREQQDLLNKARAVSGVTAVNNHTDITTK